MLHPKKISWQTVRWFSHWVVRLIDWLMENTCIFSISIFRALCTSWRNSTLPEEIFDARTFLGRGSANFSSLGARVVDLWNFCVMRDCSAWLIDWLIDGLTDCSAWLIDWLTDCSDLMRLTLSRLPYSVFFILNSLCFLFKHRISFPDDLRILLAWREIRRIGKVFWRRILPSISRAAQHDHVFEVRYFYSRIKINFQSQYDATFLPDFFVEVSDLMSLIARGAPVASIIYSKTILQHKYESFLVFPLL